MSFDNIWQWSETAASNTAVASIDITGATGRVNNGDNAMRAIMSQIITTEGKGSSIASAATLTLTGPERYFHITGNTGPITDIDFTDAVDGRWAWLIFDSTPTITHNATTLILPGGANIVAAAGDRGLFIQDASDNVICLAYVRAGGSTATFTNTGLHILDTNASHDLIIAPGSNITADRTLTVTTGDADHTLNISGSPTSVVIASGTYTPTITGTANVTASTAYLTMYTRMNDVVTVTGKVAIDPTAGATNTTFRITLPIASNLANEEDLAGVGFVGAATNTQGWTILADTTNDAASFQGFMTNANNLTTSFVFSYIVK